MRTASYRRSDRSVAGPPGRRPPTEHPLLALQRQVGNQAVVRLTSGAGTGPGAGRVVGGPIPIQLAGTGAGVLPAPAEQRDALQGDIDRQVNALADLDDRSIPEAGAVEAGRVEVGHVAEEQQALGIAGNPALAALMAEDQSAPGAADAPAVAAELAGAQGDVELEEPQPSRWARFSGAVGRGASAVGRGFGRIGRGISDAVGGLFGTSERRSDTGAKAQTGASLGALGAGHANQVMGVALPAATPTLADGDYAKAVTSGGFEAAHTVASTIGLFFSALKAAVDLRSMTSTIRVIRGLKAAKAAALASGADPAMVEMVDYAIRKKYHKVVKKAIGAAAALAALGVGLAILVANPAGASLAALIIGGIGLGVFLYRIGKWAWKKWKTHSLGQKRAHMADRLYTGVIAGNPLALDAARSLHLSIDDLRSAPDGRVLIMRKLKSL